MIITFENKPEYFIMRRSTLNLTLVVFLILLISSCHQYKQPALKIAMSKARSANDFGNYGKWLKSADTSLIIIDMYSLPMDSALKVLAGCSGLLLNGGADVYPGLYNKEEDTSKCGKIDFKRDSLEFALIKIALEMKLPILGVCRGLQILNIYNGGSLFADIPTDFDTTVTHRCKNSSKCFHGVKVIENTLLAEISQVTEGTTNSNHHQGIDKLSPNFIANAYSDDGLIETIQWKDPNNKSFLLAVQWHPERMDYTNPLSMPIAMYFLGEMKEYSLGK